MANQAEVIRILGQIKDASSITIEASVRDRLIEVIGQALDAGIAAGEIAGFYVGKSTIADGTVELLTRVEAAGVGEATRALPPPIAPGVQAPVGGTEVPAVDQTQSPISEIATPAEAAQILGDPDLIQAPQSVITWLSRIIESPDFGGTGAFFADYDPEAGEIILIDSRGEPSVFSILNGGASIVPKEIAGAGDSKDIANANLINQQAAQIAALMRGDLIPLEDGRSILRGTTTIIDTRTPGEFAPIEGIPGTFYDPVTGSFLDNNGNVLAKDKFEFERDFIFPEEQRQFDEQLAFDKENTQATNRRQVLSSLVTLQGQLDARGIAGAVASQDPGNFVAAENIRRGLAPPVQGEASLFRDVDFGSGGLAAAIAGLNAPLPEGSTGGAVPGDGLAGAVSGEGQFPPEVQAVLDKAQRDADIANALRASAAEADAPVGSNVDPDELARLQEIARQGNLSNIVKPKQEVAAPPPAFDPEEEGFDPSLSFAHGGATTAPAFQVGDPVPGTDKPNPEIVLNPNREPLQVIKLSDIINQLPKFFAGTASGLSTAAAPQDFPQLRQDPTAPVARTTQDVDIQQTPGLRFIQGGGDEDFNRLSTSTIEGPFGTGLPLAGALNFTRSQEALQDPITGPLLSSLYRAASLDFAGAVARARKRAPTGQSLSTSLVRT